MRRLLLCLAVGVLAAGAPLFPGAASPKPFTIARHFTPADRVSGRYQYLPFEVPAGTASLRIAYAYDRADGENVVDLGLFEPGPLELGTAAFRGYSGGAKSEVIVGGADTTRGYRQGPIPAGTWHVMLGLYKVAEAGAAVTVTVEATPGPPAAPPSKGLTPPLATPGGARWYTGALHTHTLHSDGTVAPLELIRLVREAGFDFVVVTDHNNTTHRQELSAQIAAGELPLWIVGEEVTTPSGHASVWGLGPGEWVDFRVEAKDGTIGQLVTAARRQGALFSINHPVSDCVGCTWEHEIVDGIAGMEVANAGHGAQQQALALWDRQLTAGRRITGVGSSDWHSAPHRVDVANVRVFASALTEEAVLQAIEQGRVIVMRSGSDATPDVRVRAGGRTAAVGDSLTLPAGAPVEIDVHAAGLGAGRLVVVTNGERTEAVSLDAGGRARVERRLEPGYLRLEISAPDGTPVALTNPIYLVRP